MSEAAAQQVTDDIQQMTTTNGTHKVYTWTIDETLLFFETDHEIGLTQLEAIKRLQRDGPNELFGNAGPSLFAVLIANIFNPMNGILIIATGLALGVKDWAEASVLIFVILTNTIIGFIQEYRSEKTMDALRSMASPTARVLRGREVEVIVSQQVCKGDIIILEEGDIVPADIRIVEAINFQVDEALLTGEAIPITKHNRAILDSSADEHHDVAGTSSGEQAVQPLNHVQDIPVGDRKNMAFKNTLVTKGRAKGIVTAIGLQTEVGKIAQLVTDASKKKGSTSNLAIEKTPLQKTLTRMMFYLLGVAVVLALVVFGAAKFVITTEVMLYAIGVAVAILPEGLPAVLTVTMAMGVRRMAKQKAIVRRLAALEALGQVSNICSDKTGTLTEGKMAAKRMWLAKTFYSITGKGIDPIGEITNEDTQAKLTLDHIKSAIVLDLAMHASLLCTTSTLFYDNEDNRWKSSGDPTEIALQVLAHKAGLTKECTKRDWEFVGEHGFDSSLKRMSVIYKPLHFGTSATTGLLSETVSEMNQENVFVFTKGALERVLECCDTFLDTVDGQTKPLTDTFVNEAHSAMLAFASKGMRVLALAYKMMTTVSSESGLKRGDCEAQLVFIGLVAIYDPPRPETEMSIRQCKEAGVIVHMATGDHPVTAEAIAREVGIIGIDDDTVVNTVLDQMDNEKTTGNDKIGLATEGIRTKLVMTAAQFDSMSNEEIDALPELPRVLARCSPESKVKLLDALHRRGKLIAMTGDGVNDAPAVQKADIGIAMGLGGSDVTKQASSITLTDDNFNTIVNAIREGRRLFGNSTKVALHLLSGNVAEVIALVIGLAVRDGMDTSIFPMSPIQILWLNMVTSTPVALALGMERESANVMKVPPRAKDASFWTRGLLTDTFVYGTFMGLEALGAFLISMSMEYGGNWSDLPSGCNKYDSTKANPLCDGVYRSRGCSFYLLSLLLLIHGFNCRDLHTSMFRYPKENKWIWYAFVLGLCLTIPTAYIPTVNLAVFQQLDFGVKWVIVCVGIVVFVVFSECYKVMKRIVYLRIREEKKSSRP